MNLIKTLIKLEPVFKQAIEIACEMQSTAKQYNKYDTGVSVIDIVTEADLAVQEFLLQELIKTDLVDCRLLAEEDTPLVSRFTNKNGHYLTIDPIDGTAIYSKGGKAFSIIISFHDGKNLLYTYEHYPILDWTQKIINNTYTTVGDHPKFLSPYAGKEKILYYEGAPEKRMPKVYQDLTSKGMTFINCLDHLEDVSEQTMFICNQIGGFYAEDPNVYDGLVVLHATSATNRKIYSSHSSSSWDLSNIQKRKSGLYYPGHYLTLN